MKNDIDERLLRMIKAAPEDVEDGDASPSFYWRKRDKNKKKKSPNLIKIPPGFKPKP